MERKHSINALQCCSSGNSVSNNMKREQIIKALKSHKKRRCYDCPLGKEDIEQLNRPCSTMIAEIALALINELTEENEEVHANWQKLSDSYAVDCADHYKKGCADTVRKMQLEIKSRCIEGGIYPAFVERTVDQIAKEMLEED